MMIHLFAEVLTSLDTPMERMAKLEEFDEKCGASIPNWEKRMKEQISELGGKRVKDAIDDVDAFHAKYHVRDSQGNRVFDRFRIGSGRLITFDANAPEGKKITLNEIPDLDAMSLSELKAYQAEVQAAFDVLEGDEPDEDSDDYDDWEDQCDALEDELDEISERIEELSEDD